MANINDLITIQNIDSEPFHLIYGNLSYAMIQPGEVKTYPRYIAEHARTHIVDQALNHLGLATNHATKRPELEKKVFINEQLIVDPVPLSEAQQLYQESMRVAKDHETNLPVVDPTDRIMQNHARASVDTSATDVLPEIDSTEAPSNEIPADFPVAPVVPQTVAVAVAASEVATEPSFSAENPQAPVASGITRDQLYAYGEQSLGMHIYSDPKSKANLDAMTVEQVKTELQYGQ